MNTTTTPAARSNFIALGTQGSYSVGSDRYPCTVIAVSPSGHRVTVRDVTVTEWTAYPDSRGVAFEDDGKGRLTTYTRRQDGTYREQGSAYGRLALTGWKAYQDPSF